ncbi:MAG: 4-hydroxybenzoyl-CoA thioesterase [marine bacterium B5-7]|nr:MAG: 4-hydroxybenzoyl-CoA thioesterase [marine bacterium B5-7]
MSKKNPAATPTYEFVVEWGDCDPADIVYYPNYYRWFDNASHRLIVAAGYFLDVVRDEHLALGFPLVNAEASFSAPARVGDHLQIHSQVIAAGRKSFTIEHEVMRAETVLVVGREIRIMGKRNANGILEAMILPEKLKQAFGVE